MTLLTCSYFRCRASLFMLVGSVFAQVGRAEAPSVVGKMPEDSIPALKSALEVAAKQSPTLLAKAIQLEQSELDIISTRASMLPRIDGSGSFASTTVYPKEGDSNKSQGPYYNLGVSQPIYQWNALKNQLEISRIALKMSQKNTADAYRGLVNNLRSQFLGLINKKLLLRTMRFNLNLTQKYLALDEERLKAGVLSPVELVIPRMNSAQAQLDMARAEEDYEHMRRSFVRLSGIESLREESIPLEVPKWAGSPELIASLAALLQRDGVDVTLQGQLNTLSLKRADLTYQIAKVRLYPKMSASAGVSQSNSQTVTENFASQSSARSYNYGIVAAWTIFDGFAARSAKLSALAGKRSLELERTQLQAALTEEVRSSARAIDFSAQALVFAEQRQAQAAYNVDRAKDELQRGNVSEQAVDSALQKLYVQDGSLAASRSDLLSVWISFVSLLNADPMLEKMPFAYVH